MRLTTGGHEKLPSVAEQNPDENTQTGAEDDIDKFDTRAQYNANMVNRDAGGVKFVLGCLVSMNLVLVARLAAPATDEVAVPIAQQDGLARVQLAGLADALQTSSEREGASLNPEHSLAVGDGSHAGDARPPLSVTKAVQGAKQVDDGIVTENISQPTTRASNRMQFAKVEVAKDAQLELRW